MIKTLQNELAVLCEGAAVFPLTDRAFLRITGPDATRWLNGMVTNNIKDLAPGEGNYNFLLNAQGRIQGDCTIYRDPSEDEAIFLLETDASQLDTIHQLLDKFIIMDDVDLSPAYKDDAGLSILGIHAPQALATLALPAIDPLHLVHAHTPHGIVLLYSPALAAIPRFQLRAPAATIEALRAASSLPTAETESIEQLRILSGTPKFGVDIRDRDLPQETAQTHALHFAKGCYLGQEIVERIRSRGQVHRTFSQFQLTGSLPELPTPLESNGKAVGELTSAVAIDDTLYALGYIRREALDLLLTYPGGAAIADPGRIRSLQP